MATVHLVYILGADINVLFCCDLCHHFLCTQRFNQVHYAEDLALSVSQLLSCWVNISLQCLGIITHCLSDIPISLTCPLSCLYMWPPPPPHWFTMALVNILRCQIRGCAYLTKAGHLLAQEWINPSNQPNNPHTVLWSITRSEVWPKTWHLH